MSVVLVLLAFLSCATAQGILHLNEGAICKDGSPPWYCRLHSACPGIHEAIQNHRFPKICSFKDRRNPIVCCQPTEQPNTTPTTTTSTYRPSWMQPNGQPIWGGGATPTNQGSVGQPNGRVPGKISKAKCKEYEKYVYKRIPSPVNLPGQPDSDDLIPFCGRVVQPLIVKGEDAGPREFPHMARIGYGPENKIQWLCGGSLISERYILSAAHCTKPGPNRVASWANLGDLDVTTNIDDAQPVTIKIIQTINHPGYTGREMYHDISLYKLEKDAPLGIYIRPICLYTKTTIPNPKATASGWGHTFWHGYGSAKLQKVDLNIVSNKVCNDSYQANIGKDRELPQGIVSDYMICAGGHDGKDTCQGDSGGPFQIALETPYCAYAIIGVTSFGKACGTDTPAVYTNVGNYVKWIEDIVWPA